jgi:hypothetical protein
MTCHRSPVGGVRSRPVGHSLDRPWGARVNEDGERAAGADLPSAIAGNLVTAPALMGKTVVLKPSPTQQLAGI